MRRLLKAIDSCYCSDDCCVRYIVMIVMIVLRPQPRVCRVFCWSITYQTEFKCKIFIIYVISTYISPWQPPSKNIHYNNYNLRTKTFQQMTTLKTVEAGNQPASLQKRNCAGSNCFRTKLLCTESLNKRNNSDSYLKHSSLAFLIWYKHWKTYQLFNWFSSSCMYHQTVTSFISK